MTPHLVKTCDCGRSASAECPTLSDLPAAQAQLAGWGHDERGRVRCPECIGQPVERTQPEQLSLLEEAA